MACGDSTGPSSLSVAQVNDMLDAMAAVSTFASVPGTGMVVVTVSETVDCPNGGTASVSGTVDENETAGTSTATVTQSFSGCAGTSSSGRLWTFDGNPNIVTNVSTSFNEATGAFSITSSQVGGIRFASDLGSGSCQINLTFTMSGNQSSVTGSLSGSACGRNIQQSISVTQ
jgi:hypothetical protein